jgi:hypothetical protein
MGKGRKRSEKQDEIHKGGGRKNVTVKTGTTPAKCDKCGCTAMKSNTTGKLLAHYKGDGETWCK